MTDILGFVATLVFGVVWVLACWVVVTEPPPDIEPDRMVFIYVILACGVLVVFRSLALGF